MSKIFEQLLEKRCLGQDFLCPKYEDGADPFSLYSMEQAIARIVKAIENHEKILIYGDYDVDGVTASTVMEQTLILAGSNSNNIGIMLPDRFADGYGMSPKLVARAKAEQIGLVITVDCGSRNHAIIEELNTLDIDTIVTDHHETATTMPAAIAVINPHRKDHPTKDLQNLAGVGVAFKVAEALVQKNLIPPGQEKWLLDLVLLGTICDSMLLTGENRRLGFYGVKVLAKTRRPGLKELMQKARIKSINTESVGFQIGPRLNAAGRLESADLSLDLLRATNLIEAAPLAERLEQLNKRRKLEQRTATEEIEKRGISSDPVLVETGSWHEGILGIVAGRLVEEYHKPAFVLAKTENNTYKGSGRSFGDFNLAEALKQVEDSIISGGGHAGAAGVRVDESQLSDFRTKLNEYYHSLHLIGQDRFFKNRADLDIRDFSEINLDLLEELSQLEPYGPGNEEPIFHLKDVTISNITRMGAERNHLRLDLKDKNGKSLKCLAFFAPEAWLDLDPAFDRVEPLVKFTENDFNGVKSIEARIIDICYN